jgi:type I restriction enzyme S subunit
MSIAFPLGKLEFDPPPHWTQASVGRICDENDGEVQTGPFGSQLHASDYSEDGVPVVMPQDMDDGKILTSKVARVDSSHVERLSKHMLRTGDIVFSRRGDVTRFAVVNCAEQGWLCGTGSMRIRLNSPGVDTQFLRRFLQIDSVGKWLNHQAKGITMPNLNTGILRALPLYFPPLPEQRRIAAILDKADAIRRKREEGIRLTEELLHSTFQQMFGDPATNPKGWEVSTLGTITDLVTSGLTPTGGSTVYVEEGPIFIRSQNVLMNRLDLSDVACLPKAIHESMSRTKIHEGDVLLNITGASIGRVARVNALPEEANVNQHVCIIRIDRTKATPEFISAYISLPFGQRQIDNMQSGASRQGLNHQQVRSLKIPLPPLSLQQRYSKAVTMLRKVSDQREQGRLASEELFNSLVQRAFRGEI